MGRWGPRSSPFARSSGNKLNWIRILQHLLVLLLKLHLHLPSIARRGSCETYLRDISWLLFLLLCVFPGRRANIFDSGSRSRHISFNLRLDLELINFEQAFLSQVIDVFN